MLPFAPSCACANICFRRGVFLDFSLLAISAANQYTTRSTDDDEDDAVGRREGCILHAGPRGAACRPTHQDVHNGMRADGDNASIFVNEEHDKSAALSLNESRGVSCDQGLDDGWGKKASIRLVCAAPPPSHASSSNITRCINELVLA
jgi:hypothetical protein